MTERDAPASAMVFIWSKVRLPVQVKNIKHDACFCRWGVQSGGAMLFQPSDAMHFRPKYKVGFYVELCKHLQATRPNDNATSEGNVSLLFL